ncbi:hypothetical protein SAMN05216241_105138 [Limimonas halophila]|uniref:Uncharacterized protein n=1 Tax=Limimonas halophila TaxID=1082479 RepID=A0A1G7RHT5_9PROT|nr:hypothetical protein [Limimonas halophila]SDG10311.1 hypothetical protein SAMN05216241_105138 [Limimonas halophila]
MTGPTDDAAAPEEPASLLGVAIVRGGRARRAASTAHPPAEAGTATAPANESAPHPAGTGAAAPETGRGAAEAPRYRSLRQYWRSLGGGPLPNVRGIEPAVVADQWPYAVLFRAAPDGALDIARVYEPAEAAGGLDHPLADDPFSEVSTWLMEVARAAADRAVPTTTSASFRVRRRQRAYAAAAAPFAADGDTDGQRRGSAAYVLLAVTRKR